jgi:hypothetical protein
MSNKGGIFPLQEGKRGEKRRKEGRKFHVLKQEDILRVIISKCFHRLLCINESATSESA